MDGLINDRSDSRAILRHALSKMQRQSPRPVLRFGHAEDLLRTMKLPGFREQLDNLIVWMARVTKGYGGTVHEIAENALGAVGALDRTGLNFSTSLPATHAQTVS